ncbi:IgGFc-binding protein [Paraliomyxa miuraensis]|uniref:IgGFc-binding protein n=1 Tax=Paraliomyxa miuraensis TaxID=376150 RepID=UPI0022554791|nr:IgGFc-binding protein [Paraliomyxa miuraensis]MCX4247527.1 IgGFc-binding protein [Paraliomyxa miuraensis]
MPRSFGCTGTLVLVAMLSGCPGEDPEGSSSTTGVVTITATTGPIDPTATGSTSSVDTTAATTSMGSATTGEDSDTGPSVLFDLQPPDGDMGTPPPVMPTCDNLEMLGPTSIGCEFWATAVPASGGAGLGWGVSVGNPFDLDVTVTIEDLRGAGGTLRMFHQFVLGPRESQIIDMNGNVGGVMPGENHTAPFSGMGNNVAFRVSSDSPVTAMQINPIGGAPSFVPDASMLLPINALGQAYYGMGYGAGGFVIAVATQDGTTLNTDAGMQVLDAFDVYTFSIGDPTGFFVGSDKPVAVFSGSSCVNVPAGAGWCDHVEEAVIPLAAWGTSYVAARHPQREPMLSPPIEPVYWRVIAGVDNITIDVDPPGIVPGDQISLAAAGDWTEVSSTQSFVLDAPNDKPFMVVQYMAGGSTVFNATSCTPGPAVGDPYMMQMVPTEQWLTSLPFLTDTSYARDFVLLVRETGTQVELDCLGLVDASHFTAIPGTPYEVGSVQLDNDGMGGEGSCTDGQQFMTSSNPVGVLVGGYDCAASYGYPGGLSLDALWMPPTDPPG